MNAASALLRTALADPRPAIGLFIGHTTAAVVLSAVLGGTVTAVAGAGVAFDGLETILTVTVAVAVAASFLTSRAFATALQPELSRLHVLGAPARAPLFGVASTAVAVVSGVLVAGATAPQLGLLWSRQLGTLTPGHGRAEDTGGALWLVSLGLLLPSTLGWWVGGGSRGSRVERQMVIASAVAAFFIVPTILAVVFAPALVLGTQTTGDALAAERLSTLETAPAITVFSAAALGTIAAAMIASRTVVGGSLRAVAICVHRGPLSTAVGARLAARRAARFGPIATVGVGVTGLVTAQAMTSALTRPSSASAAADWRELILTLGPALSIATGVAIAASLAQARGTGNDLRALTLIGFSTRARTTVVLVTALLLGSVGSLVGASAAVSAFLLAVPFGADLSLVAVSELTVPIAVAGCSTAVIATIFLVSEWMGHRLGHRARRR
ncbi:hypothetical protein SAMN05660766_0983 [Curtobacterium sp. 314Chir4.1]|uniref:hypothetical protein n=1 Tax=Curtobacterium sp. 314Chir4.1 TaxID=1279028 RepID=UPI000BC8055C|nr:hypothetical protein [Curtobacterium sp. 314Chir4.1]SOC87314.1 hypothetical protein SAMN05660766_0983 [Curtobacterium sp. 314Chir4.1]